MAAWAGAIPETLFLTWEGDPTTTMTAQWLRGPGLGDRPKKDKPEEVRWKKADGGTWAVLETKTAPFPDPKKSGLPRWALVKAAWTGLEPGTDYIFQTGESPEMKFRTAPAKMGKELIFAEGGDSDVTKAAEEIYGAAARQDPLFIHVGGDLAYSEAEEVGKEISFWKMYQRAARAPDGRLIPFVAGIGNHEVKGGYWQEGATFAQMKEKAPFFYALFGGLYRTEEPVALDFGDYLSLLMLDSGHVAPMERQTGWLEENLAARSAVPWVFLSWHVACYPSYREWNQQPMSGYAREHWIPLIEKSRAAGVFVHHDHDLQRVETEGKNGRKIMVFGNGAIGVEPREAKCAESTRLAKFQAKENYINLVTLTADKATVRSLGREGQELDRTEVGVASLNRR
jgi:phosphodiesterase/alkaline phosphatase D-like protein